jgi:hypothetical protein
VEFSLMKIKFIAKICRTDGLQKFEVVSRGKEMSRKTLTQGSPHFISSSDENLDHVIILCPS